jgi:hypothetical protein
LFYLGTGKSKAIAGIVIRLLPKLGNTKKILLCAPSNNACDELTKRILTELGSDYEIGYYHFLHLIVEQSVYILKEHWYELAVKHLLIFVSANIFSNHLLWQNLSKTCKMENQ